MTGWRSPTLIVTLAFGVLFSLLYASANFVSSTKPAIVTVIIPEGTSLGDSGMNFEPQVITVMIGLNNTVRWINQDSTTHWIEADNQSDPEFYNVTSDENRKLIEPNESFEFTFTKAGEFGYHGKPWMHGTVIVLPPENL